MAIMDWHDVSAQPTAAAPFVSRRSWECRSWTSSEGEGRWEPVHLSSGTRVRLSDCLLAVLCCSS